MKHRVLLSLIVPSMVMADPAWELPKDGPGAAMLRDYFESQVSEIETACLSIIDTKEKWLAEAPTYRRQLQEMLGLDPWPERTPLQPTVTGTVEHPEFTVRNLHYQSLPGLYVTANLYVPKVLTGKAPAILYVCGHSHVKEDGVSLGNKTDYQRHGAWFARNGYVCLTIDTVQLGEIEGIHHGTYRYGMWWWNSRGYTSAGVEAWNGIRGLDYLCSLPEVDAEKLGVTGRSGGGAYSWYVAALDERIKAAVPVAGITSLRNHVIDGCVEGHCDCMFPQNLYRWDYGQMAALVAPRPLLISNTDKDTIFPLEGVVQVHERARRIYRLLGADEQLGLQITEGPHKDTQELHIHSFVWFDRFLKGKSEPIEKAAVNLFPNRALRVFQALPKDERTSKIHESFLPAAKVETPKSATEWERQRDAWMGALRAKCFRGWPKEEDSETREVWRKAKDGVDLSAYEFTSQSPFRLRLYLARRAGQDQRMTIRALDEADWKELGGELEGAEDLTKIKAMLDEGEVLAFLAPRGVGPSAWGGDERKNVQIRRRFMLLGQTLDGMRVWDLRRGLKALKTTGGLGHMPIRLEAKGNMAVLALYASLYEPVGEVACLGIPASHMEGPDFFNVLKHLDIPQALALAAERSVVRVEAKADLAEFPRAVAKLLAWPEGRFQFTRLP